jgi:hypothetical protein
MTLQRLTQYPRTLVYTVALRWHFPMQSLIPSMRPSPHMQLGPANIHRTKQRDIAFGSNVEEDKDKDKDKEDYVEKLLKECATAWGDLINYPFPVKLAEGTAVLNGFRHYMIVSKTTRTSHRGISTSHPQQDATYLEYYYRVRMEFIGKSGTFEEIREFAAKLSSSLPVCRRFPRRFHE